MAEIGTATVRVVPVIDGKFIVALGVVAEAFMSAAEALQKLANAMEWLEVPVDTNDPVDTKDCAS